MNKPFPDPAHEAFVQCVSTGMPSMTYVARARTYTHDLVDQDIFPEAQVYSVSFRPSSGATPVAYVAVVDTTWSCLTGNVDSLNEIARLAPRMLDTADSVRRYARTVDLWTTTWQYGQLEINSLDDVPWNEWQDPHDQRLVAELRAHADVIGPEHMLLAHGAWLIETWVVASRKLMHRRLVIEQETGALRRLDEIVGEGLPVPLGRLWESVGDRYLPVE